MAALPAATALPSPRSPTPPRRLHHLNPNPPFPPPRRPIGSVVLSCRLRNSIPTPALLSPRASNGVTPSSCNHHLPPPRQIASPLLQVAAPAIFFLLGLGSASACAFGSSPTPNTPPLTTAAATAATATITGATTEGHDLASLQKCVDKEDNEELEREFEAWKSKSFALTVPLRIVALRGSFPASWIKDFAQSQSKRMRMIPEFHGSLQSSYNELNLESKKGSIKPKSVMAADIVSIGNSWLSFAIRAGLVEPMHGVESQEWFNVLSDSWKIFLRRNDKGELDPDGNIWCAPYRWGSMVIAYKKDKFKRKGLPPVEDWGDLWKPELAGKISMVDSPREVVGAVLKYMGASYNTKDIDSEVVGGKSAVMQNLELLQRQVRLFDSVHYLKAFTSGDVWVAVGWSSDVLPTAKRMSDVVVVTPKSGSSLWADLWAIPAATRFTTSQIGGRVRGPSPLIYQWIEFCLQPARAFPFLQQVLPGSPPFALECVTSRKSEEFAMDKSKVDKNIISGVPPPEILARCEFLEPLSVKALMDYQWLVAHMQKPHRGWISGSVDYLSSIIQRLTSSPLRSSHET